MKKLNIFLLPLLVLFSCASAGQNVKKDAPPVKYIEFGLPINVFYYTLYEYGRWIAHTDDAESLNVNLYFTRDNADYADSNSVIFFYYVDDKGRSLSDIVRKDKYDFFTEFPGIQITDYDLGSIDYQLVDKTAVKGNFSEKKYFAVMYDYSNVTVEHEDQYQLAVFFKFNTNSPYFCVLELASTDDEAFRYIEDFKKIFMAISENADESGLNI